ncbi:GNAT family N-acetyltransferase [Corynebacterium lizhenjunii]|uniref:GNAT family N-acetyltransferase n=1 Tax=Corynebacterium lizhenjunii TaxID=2709394 RepID=UPI0013EA059A|nr:GNAT family protein [Corynebacterium lizhenjunii]
MENVVDNPVGLAQIWPPFGLQVVATDERRRIELRALRDEHIAQLAGVTPEAIYGSDVPEYAFSWLFGQPPVWAGAQFRWGHRASMSPQEWTLDCGVFLDGQLCGAVDLRAQNFAQTREVETGSWIYHRYQGQGIGTLVRHAVAATCFEHLGAHSLRSHWVVGNAASAAVSAKLGYKVYRTAVGGSNGPDGVELPVEDARLDRKDYQPGGVRVQVSGVTPQLRALLGIDGPGMTG